MDAQVKDRVVIDPRIMTGKQVMRGMRVPVDLSKRGVL